MKNQQVQQLMNINMQDQRKLLCIIGNCKDHETKAELLKIVDVYQQRWDDLYELSWK